MTSPTMRVLMVDGATPHRDASAGERATFDLVDGIRHLGHDLTFTTIGVNADHDRRAQLLSEYGLPLPAGAGGGAAHLRELVQSEHWDAVIVHRPGPALAALHALNDTSAARIMWGHDIHTWRLQAQAAQGIAVPRHQLLVTEVSERRCWNYYDLTVYPTDREARHISARVDSLGRGVAFPYYRLTESDCAPPTTPHADRHGCLMVGSAAHEPNRDAAEFAVHEVLPILRATDPDATLTVVGAWSPASRQPLEGDGVRFVGQVSDDELVALHQSHLCLLAPLRFGSGSRRKVVGAMGLGLPVVTTPEGMRGLLVRDGDLADGPLVADDAPSLAAHITALTRYPQRWQHASDTGQRAASQVYGQSAFDAALADLLARTRQRTSTAREPK